MKIEIKSKEAEFIIFDNISIEHTDFSHLVYAIACSIECVDLEYIDIDFDYVDVDGFCMKIKDKDETRQTILAILEELSMQIDTFYKVSEKIWYMRKYSSQLVSRMEVLRKLEEKIFYCLNNEPSIMEK